MLLYCRRAAKTGRFKLNGKEHPFEMNVRQGVTVDLVGLFRLFILHGIGVLQLQLFKTYV